MSDLLRLSCYEATQKLCCPIRYSLERYKDNSYSEAFNRVRTLLIDDFKNKMDVDSILKNIDRNVDSIIGCLNIWDAEYQKADNLLTSKAILHRFCVYLAENVEEILAIDTPTHAVVDENLMLTSKVNIIYKSVLGKTVGMVISNSKTMRSAKSRSGLIYQLNSDLDILVGKYSLFDIYPDLELERVCLRREGEKVETMQDMSIGVTLKDTVFQYNFADSLFSDGGECSKDKILAQIKSVLAEPVNKKCKTCKSASICSYETLDNALYELFEDEEPKVADYSRLSAEQFVVAKNSKYNLVCLAGPGSGKTHTLIARTLNLLKRGVPYSNIMCITYTNKAAGEMRERLSLAGIKDMPLIGTIHSVCFDIVHKECKRVLGFIPHLLDNAMQISIIKKLYLELRDYDDNGNPIPPLGFSPKMNVDQIAFQLAKDVDDYALCIASNCESKFWDEHPNRDLCFKTFAEKYFKYIKSHNLYTFDGYVQLACDILDSDAAVLKKHVDTWKFIMVDEYQDCNYYIDYFVRKIWAETNNLVVFGDDDQAIYGFRGGSGEYMRRLASRPDFYVAPLSINYRSDPQIVNHSSKIMAAVKERIPKRSEPINGSGSSSLRCTPLTDNSSLQKLIDSFKAEGFSNQDICITTYKNSTLNNIHASLSTPSVLAVRELGSTAYANIINLLLNVIFDKDEQSMAILLYVLGISEFATHKNLIEYITLDSSLDENPRICMIRDSITCINAARDDISALISGIATILGLQSSKEYEVMLDMVKMKDLNSLDAFSEFLSSLCSSKSSNYHVPVEQKDRVMLITQHKSKGLEWPVVILVEPEKSKDNSSSSGELSSDDDELRLLYVSITRAKTVYCYCGPKSKLLLEGDSASEFKGA